MSRDASLREIEQAEAIDCHAHYVPPELFALVEGHEARFGMAFEERDGNRLLRLEHYIYTGRPMVLAPEFWRIDARVRDMAARGVEASVLSPPTFFFHYWARVDVASEVARAVNDGLAAAVARHPGRLLGLATCPLQDGEAAAREIERALRYDGMVGAIIGTSVAGEELDRESSRAFFEFCDAARVPIFVHPTASSPAPRLQRFYLANLLGLPVETATAAAALVFGGLLDRHPDLPVMLAHGGGVFPWLASRWDQGVRVRPECQGVAARAPSEYLRRFYYDSVIHDPARLRCLVDLVGGDRVVLGTDCPADMGVDLDGPTARTVLGPDAVGFPTAAIRRENPLRWLGVPPRRERADDVWKGRR